MFYRSYTPGPPLGSLISRFWLCCDNPPHPRERILPSGTIELVFNLCDDEIRIYDPALHSRCRRFSGAVVSGPYSSFFVIDPLQHASVVGVHFRPGGAMPFLGLPAGELANTHADLADLWGPLAGQLRERLRAATPSQRFAVLETALVARLGRPPQRHDAVSVALNTFEQTGAEVRVRDLALRVGLSQRRFIQLFTAEVGLTPKLYKRIRRFQQARQLVQKTPAPDWARVAAECGYFDQSHLIRDFSAFSGLSPMAYLGQRSERVLPHHVPQEVNFFQYKPGIRAHHEL